MKKKKKKRRKKNNSNSILFYILEEKNIVRKIVKLTSIRFFFLFFFFFHFSSKVNKLKHSFRFYLFILIDRVNTFTGLPSQSYKLAAMRELHIGIPGNGDGWDTSTYPIEFIRRFYPSLKSNHVPLCFRHLV